MQLVRIVCIGFKIVAFSIFGLMLLLSNMEGNLPGILGILGIIVFVCGEIYEVIHWRCPACRKYLPPHEIFEITICPYCGYHLDKD